MGEPRDHHFMPRFFLKAWCDDSGKLIEYTKKNDKLISKSVGPGATGFQRDAYAFDKLPPDQVQFMEQCSLIKHRQTFLKLVQPVLSQNLIFGYY